MASSAAFRKLGNSNVKVYSSRPETPDELIRRIHDAEIVINIRASSRFDDRVIATSPNLRMISIWGTGTDHVDLHAAKTHRVRVTNTPGVSALAVAEHTLSLILAASKQTVVVDREVREGKWPRALVTQLFGKTLGLIGTGAIGRQVARLGKGIGMHVIAWSFRPKDDIAECVAFEDVFRQSDVVSVHVRQSPEMVGLIRQEHFQLMKPTAIFVNTARGAIVRENDLIDALTTRRIAAAGLDVFEIEPLPKNSPLLSLPNVVLSPHSAGITPEATEAGLDLVIENVFDFLSGRSRNVVV